MESDRNRDVSESYDVEMAGLDQFRDSVRTRRTQGRILQRHRFGKEREAIIRVEIRLFFLGCRGQFDLKGFKRPKGAFLRTL